MDAATKRQIAEFICGGDSKKHPIYRSSSDLSNFFKDINMDKIHDGTSRIPWTNSVIESLTELDLEKVILRLASPRLYGGNRDQIKLALTTLNEILEVEGLEIKVAGIEPKLVDRVPNYDFSQNHSENGLQPLPPPDFDSLDLSIGISENLKQRWHEVQSCLEVNATISAVIMMGSMLEGFLMAMIQQNPHIVNQSVSAPKKDGKVKAFHDWTLSDMINVGHDVGWIQLDVKKFSHALRDFRNIIHPYHQLATKINPDIDTCRISWLVIQAACNDMEKWVKQNKKQ